MNRIFVPSKKEVWSTFAREMRGSYSDGSPTENDMVRWSYKEWSFLLDSIARSSERQNTHTRLRAAFLHKKKLRFRISAKSYLAQLLGLRGISTGDDSLEKVFLIKGSNEELLIKLMESSGLVKQLKKLPYLKLKVTHGSGGWFGLHYPSEISVLHLEYPGQGLEKVILKDLSKVCQEVLDRLVEIDAASSKNPDFTL